MEGVVEGHVEFESCKMERRRGIVTLGGCSVSGSEALGIVDGSTSDKSLTRRRMTSIALPAFE